MHFIIVQVEGRNPHPRTTYGYEDKVKLQTAIVDVNAVRLRRLVAALVREDPKAEERLMEALVENTAEVDLYKDLDEDPREETCAWCGEEYNGNDPPVANECVFHHGSLIVDTDDIKKVEREGREEDPFRLYTMEEHREEHPSLFFWDCCSGDGVDRGCQRGFHEPEEKMVTVEEEE